MVPKSRWIITTRQRSCGKVMFSVMSVHGGGGSPMWCTDALALDLTVQHPPRSLGPAPLDIGTSLYSDPPGPSPSRHGDIWWPRLKTCSNLFTWGSPHPPLLAPGIENAHTVSANGWYVSYWNAFLVYIFSMAHLRFRGRKRPTQKEVQTYFKRAS